MFKSGRDRFVWAAILLTLVTISAAWTQAKPKPDVRLAPSGHVEVDEALGVGFNLLEFVASAGETGDDTQRRVEVAIEAERMRLTAVLRALGYLDARIVVDSTARERVSEPLLRARAHENLTEIRLQPDVGQLYRIGAIEVLGLDDDTLGHVREDVGGLLSQYPGQIARGDVLSKLENEIVWRARSASHAFAEVVARAVIPDERTITALVKITIEMGPPVSFGNVRFRGLVRTDVIELSSYIPFSAGDAYSVEAFEQFRHALESLPMFRDVRVAVSETADAEGRLPVEVRVREAPPDPKQLSRRGMIGMSITAGALGLLGLRQLLVATGAAQNRLLRGIDLMVFGLIVAAVQLGWQRVVELAGIG
jgi:hypothetical protein